MSPIIKANPFLSLWLSAANAWAGAARGLWLTAAQRQQAEAMESFLRETTRAWMGACSLPALRPMVQRAAGRPRSGGADDGPSG